MKMNSSLSFALKNVFHTSFSNLVSFMVSTLVVLIVPKIIGVEEYSYWQLYLFYSGYAGFLNFGWPEGIYLRYGGKTYNDLDSNNLGVQFFLFFGFQIFVAIIFCVIALLYPQSANDRNIFYLFCLCIISFVPRAFLWVILQATNRIKEYANLTLLDRVLYLIFLTSLLLIGFRDYTALIICDLASKFITLYLSIKECKDLFIKIEKTKINIKSIVIDIRENIKSGINLTCANISSMLIIGVVRMGIQRYWDITTFGITSLTLSISNLLMTFIRAISVVIFPIIKKANNKDLSNIYDKIRTVLITLLFGLLILYFPIKEILIRWLPKYQLGLQYMALLFPMCIFESKMAMLVETYLKAYRKERYLLKINVFTMILSIVTTFIFADILHNLTLSLLMIVVLIAFRCSFAEFYLCNLINISCKKEIFQEIIMTAIFIISNWCIGGIFGLSIYIICYIVFIIINKQKYFELKRFLLKIGVK